MNYWNKVRLVMMGLLKAQLQTDQTFPLDGLDLQIEEKTAVLRCSSFEAILELPQEEWDVPDLEPDPSEQALTTLVCMNLPDIEVATPFLTYPVSEVVIFSFLNRKLVPAYYYIATLSALIRLAVNPDDLTHIANLYYKFLEEEAEQ